MVFEIEDTVIILLQIFCIISQDGLNANLKIVFQKQRTFLSCNNVNLARSYQNFVFPSHRRKFSERRKLSSAVSGMPRE